MIYGLNINGVAIPDDIARKFASRLDGAFRSVGRDRGCVWLLQGVCESQSELAQMRSAADNGHRRFFTRSKVLHLGPSDTPRLARKGKLFFALYIA